MTCMGRSVECRRPSEFAHLVAVCAIASGRQELADGAGAELDVKRAYSGHHVTESPPRSSGRRGLCSLSSGGPTSRPSAQFEGRDGPDESGVASHPFRRRSFLVTRSRVLASAKLRATERVIPALTYWSQHP
jgi:hypothetical protein